MSKFHLASFLTVFSMLISLSIGQATANGVLELGTKSPDQTIVAIGSVPEKKKIQLELGGLRTREAQLPPAPLTRNERMALRAKRAVDRQRQVSNARRHRPPPPPPSGDLYDESEGFPVDGNGEPILE